MKAFVELTERPYPTPKGWVVGQLSRNTLRQVVADNEGAARGIDCAVERRWILEKAPDTDIYCPTETGFRECWNP